MQFERKMWKNILEYLGIDPSTSRMLSGRSTIWASTPHANLKAIIYFNHYTPSYTQLKATYKSHHIPFIVTLHTLSHHIPLTYITTQSRIHILMQASKHYPTTTTTFKHHIHINIIITFSSAPPYLHAIPTSYHYYRFPYAMLTHYTRASLLHYHVLSAFAYPSSYFNPYRKQHDECWRKRNPPIASPTMNVLVIENVMIEPLSTSLVRFVNT